MIFTFRVKFARIEQESYSAATNTTNNKRKKGERRRGENRRIRITYQRPMQTVVDNACTDGNDRDHDESNDCSVH
jgi:hypothetical protein